MRQARFRFLIGRGWYRDVLEDLRRLLAAGVAMVEALDTVAESSRGAPAEFARELRDCVRGGATLAEALAANTQVPEEHAALVEAGERSGTLVAVLENLVARIDRRRTLVAELRAKVSYPALVLCVAVTLLPLPWVFSGDALLYLAVEAAFWGGLTSLAVLFFLGPRWLAGKPELQLAIERVAMRIPILGSSLVESAAGKALGLLGLLLGSGLSISAALQLAAKTARLSTLRRALQLVEPKLAAGSSLNQAFAAVPFFSSRRLWIGRIAAAEKAGALDQIFSELGEELERSAYARLGLVLRIVPVVLLIGVGALVLVQMLRTLLPLYGGL